MRQNRQIAIDRGCVAGGFSAAIAGIGHHAVPRARSTISTTPIPWTGFARLSVGGYRVPIITSVALITATTA